ncbi:MAG: hypothetical protein K0Q65_1528 [Clostridia bacterium]|nr:hypothetical protein [Clostridia bacterium]
MFSQIGRSVYVSTFERQKDRLLQMDVKGSFVFTSFHIQEELDDQYKEKAKALCNFLKEAGFIIIGDVSPKTLKFFGYEDISRFAEDMDLDVLRIDYGFSLEEVMAIHDQFGIAFNASTVNPLEAKVLIDAGKQVYAMHNYYPRSETGLDDEYFRSVNQKLQAIGLKVLAFIPGDEIKRGPIEEGLPTLERHRNIPPYVGYLDLAVNFNMDGIFIGDVQLSKKQESLIRDYCRDGVIIVPSTLNSEYEYLYGKKFTIRIDSPAAVMRLQESREYSCQGKLQEPKHCIIRSEGAITMDNKNYGRYSGEIQIIRQNLPQDDRVNVIGHIEEEYITIMHCIKNGASIRLERSK